MSCYWYAGRSMRIRCCHDYLPFRVVKWLWVALALLCGCGCVPSAIREPTPGLTPVRFLLTFDDGPSLWQPYNPTSVVLDTLAQNSVQAQIKAVFFVQTRSPSAGGSEL